MAGIASALYPNKNPLSHDFSTQQPPFVTEKNEEEPISSSSPSQLHLSRQTAIDMTQITISRGQSVLRSQPWHARSSRTLHEVMVSDSFIFITHCSNCATCIIALV